MLQHVLKFTTCIAKISYVTEFVILHLLEMSFELYVYIWARLFDMHIIKAV